MIRQVVYAGFLMAEFLSHTTMAIAGTDSISSWSIGACGLSLIAGTAAAIHAVREILSLEGSTAIE